MKKRLQRVRDRLAKGDAILGPFMKTCDPAFVEAGGYAGFDFVILDMEHGPASLETMPHLIRAAQCVGLLPIVRVRDRDEVAIGQVLDLGAGGVHVPQVRTAAEAAQVVSAARFYPNGQRGVCRFVRAANYSAMNRQEYFSAANDVLVIVAIEGNEAIANLDGILATPGLDILFVGPYDLSQSMGLPGQVSHPDVIEKMREIVEAAARKGIVVGTFTDTPELASLWRDAGVQYLSYSVDVGIFVDACREIASNFQR